VVRIPSGARTEGHASSQPVFTPVDLCSVILGGGTISAFGAFALVFAHALSVVLGVQATPIARKYLNRVHCCIGGDILRHLSVSLDRLQRFLGLRAGSRHLEYHPTK
jgi:hypothetical protein